MPLGAGERWGVDGIPAAGIWPSRYGDAHSP